MTFFDPSIYCKQNLKKKDLETFEFAEKIAKEALETALNAIDDYGNGMSAILDRVEREIVDSFAEEFKTQLGYILQDYVVGTIDCYEEETEEVAEPETYYYIADDEIEDDLPFTAPDDNEE